MYENFTRIPTAEQERILDACLDEFARNGYAAASTNAIVRQAGIPKGTLFFYFGSKKDLFLYLIDQAIERYLALGALRKEALPADLFERLLFLGRERMRFALQEPRFYHLLFNAFTNLPAEIYAEMQARFGQYSAASAQMLGEGLDLSRFRPGVDPARATAMITTLLEGIYARSLPMLSRMSPEESLAYVEGMSTEVQQYFEMIRRGVYQN